MLEKRRRRHFRMNLERLFNALVTQTGEEPNLELPH